MWILIALYLIYILAHQKCITVLYIYINMILNQTELN